MGQTPAHEYESMLKYCNFCDDNEHNSKECEEIAKLRRCKDSIRAVFYYSSSKNKLWRLEPGKITKKLVLYDDHYVFWLDTHGNRPMYFFDSSKTDNPKIEEENQISVLVYPYNIRHPDDMQSYFVQRIENF